MSDQSHYLDSYLSQALPSLGLDFDTYAPYVTGYANDDDDGDDETTLDDLIELLRASSESHGDDDEAWCTFREEVVKRRHEFLMEEDARKVS